MTRTKQRIAPLVTSGLRTLDIWLARNGSVIHHDTLDEPQDVFIGPESDYPTVHPSVPRMFWFIEASPTDFQTLYLLPDMKGWIKQGGVVTKIQSVIRRMQHAFGNPTTLSIDLTPVVAAHIRLGNDRLNCTFVNRRVIVRTDPPVQTQLSLPYRAAYPVRVQKIPKVVAVPPAKFLRVSQREGHIVVKESYLETPGPVAIGPREEFRVRSPDIPNRFTLFRYAFGIYYLHFLDSWTGQVLLHPGEGARPLHELRQSKAEHVAVGIYRLRLTPETMGMIKIGSATFLFSFAVPPS